jgi:hypothetical protein
MGLEVGRRRVELACLHREFPRLQKWYMTANRQESLGESYRIVLEAVGALGRDQAAVSGCQNWWGRISLRMTPACRRDHAPCLSEEILNALSLKEC